MDFVRCPVDLFLNEQDRKLDAKGLADQTKKLPSFRLHVRPLNSTANGFDFEFFQSSKLFSQQVKEFSSNVS
jgi:hypothetical protein